LDDAERKRKRLMDLAVKQSRAVLGWKENFITVGYRGRWAADAGEKKRKLNYPECGIGKSRLRGFLMGVKVTARDGTED